MHTHTHAHITSWRKVKMQQSCILLYTRINFTKKDGKVGILLGYGLVTLLHETPAD
jgi:hypothetical protein